MTIKERTDLEEEQEILAEMYLEVESNPDKYKNFQGMLDLLDDRMECNRCLLEGGWQDG